MNLGSYVSKKCEVASEMILTETVKLSVRNILHQALLLMRVPEVTHSALIKPCVQAVTGLIFTCQIQPGID